MNAGLNKRYGDVGTSLIMAAAMMLLPKPAQQIAKPALMVGNVLAGLIQGGKGRDPQASNLAAGQIKNIATKLIEKLTNLFS